MATATTSPSSSPSAVKPVPEGFHTITPYLVCAGAADAIAFYQKAFGATELMRLAGPDGKIVHASLKIGDSVLMLNEEFPQMGAVGPKTLKGSPVTIHLYVPDVDAAFDRAVKAGAMPKLPPQDMFWGDHYSALEDPFGHSWSIASKTRNLAHEEIQKAAVSAMC